MGRRRTIGQARSAGAGRACPHPVKQREYQPAARTFRVRCRRCGQDLLGLEPPAPRPRDKPWRPPDDA
jgi:hypothetical protein